eukprot:3751187-Alexandrium_andersonii.AAC.1
MAQRPSPRAMPSRFSAEMRARGARSMAGMCTSVSGGRAATRSSKAAGSAGAAAPTPPRSGDASGASGSTGGSASG